MCCASPLYSVCTNRKDNRQEHSACFRLIPSSRQFGPRKKGDRHPAPLPLATAAPLDQGAASQSPFSSACPCARASRSRHARTRVRASDRANLVRHGGSNLARPRKRGTGTRPLCRSRGPRRWIKGPRASPHFPPPALVPRPAGRDTPGPSACQRHGEPGVAWRLQPGSTTEKGDRHAAPLPLARAAPLDQRAASQSPFSSACPCARASRSRHARTECVPAKRRTWSGTAAPTGLDHGKGGQAPGPFAAREGHAAGSRGREPVPIFLRRPGTFREHTGHEQPDRQIQVLEPMTIHPSARSGLLCQRRLLSVD